MRIVFDPTSIHQSRLGSVTGVVYYDFGGDQQFPIAGWNDFVVVVANWWLAALEGMTHGTNETRLRFMDGPYWITVVSQGGSAVLLRCVEERTRASVVNEVIVEVDALSRSLKKLANDVSRACAEAHIESHDLDNLRKYLKQGGTVDRGSTAD